MGEPFGGIARFSVVDACFESKDIFDEVYDLVENTLEGSSDVFMHENFPSLGFDDNVLHNPLNHSYVSPISSLPSPSSEYYIDNPMI